MRTRKISDHTFLDETSTEHPVLYISEATLDELGFLPEQLSLIRRMMSRSEGGIILSGPTGSGKSTMSRTLVQDTTPPQIVEITGDGTGYLAILMLSNGNQVSVQTGNRIPGTEYVVKRVTLNEVVVADKNQSLMSLSLLRGNINENQQNF
ncbi:type IV pilus biogenesis protein PilP [Hafnia alvei]|nr:type IV pilus biogenesis protein PilP [Hafnia alvei]